MHTAQASSNSVTSDSSCTLDIKPTISGSGQSAPKQREGMTTGVNISNSSSNQNNNSSTLNGGLFDAPQTSGNGGSGSNNSNFNGYQSSYGYHQSVGFQSSDFKPTISPHSKTQRAKARTSAGKT